jgi:hypothetical protein
MTTLVPKYDQGGTGAVNRPFNEKLAEIVSVKDFGAVGDGTTDDTVAIQAAISYVTSVTFPSTGSGTLYFPFGRYKVTASLTVTCNTQFEVGAAIKPASIASNAVVFNVTAAGTSHTNVVVIGDAAIDPANGTVGIKAATLAYRTEFTNCSTALLKYGFMICSFSVTLLNCNSNYNFVNLTAYGPVTNSEINDLKIISGNYSGLATGGIYCMKIGDRDFATTILTSNAHGTVGLLQGFALDGGALHIDNFNNLHIDSLYFETLSSGQTKCIELGKTGFNLGVVNNITIENCLFRFAAYAIYCNVDVRNLYVMQNLCSAITASAVYIISDIYPYFYDSGYSAGSFSQGKEIHTGVRSLTAGSDFFNGGTITQYNLNKGVQTATAINDFPEWFGPARTNYGATNLFTSVGALRYYTTPATSIAGTMSGLTFTCTTLADAYKFNGGDKLTGTGAASTAVYVRQVNYETGALIISQNAGPTSGAATLSQAAPYWISTTFGTAAPTTGTYNQGSIQYNSSATVGQPKGWQCTVTGTPGTWVSMGNL